MTVMKQANPRLAVFDCDGTLVNSEVNICRAMACAFAASGHEVPPVAAIRSTIGLSLNKVMQVLSPETDEPTRSLLADRFKETLFALRSESGALGEPLFDGVADLLCELYAAGWTLGIATGKTQRGLAQTLSMHGIGHLFSTLQTSDEHPSKPHPAMLIAAMTFVGASPGSTLLIGDSHLDMAMAHAAGVRAIGVSWGNDNPDTLRAAGAGDVAHDASELNVMIGSAYLAQPPDVRFTERASQERTEN